MTNRHSLALVESFADSKIYTHLLIHSG